MSTRQTPVAGGVAAAGVTRRKAIAAALMFALPLSVALLWLCLGDAQGLRAHNVRADAPAKVPGEMVVEQLAAHLQKNPNDKDGWVALARAYNKSGRRLAAAAGYQRAVELAPGEAQLYAEYANTLMLANGNRLGGKPEQLIQSALQLDATNQNALALAGTAAFNRKDYSAAVDYWELLLKQLPQGSEGARAVADNS